MTCLVWRDYSDLAFLLTGGSNLCLSQVGPLSSYPDRHSLCLTDKVIYWIFYQNSLTSYSYQTQKYYSSQSRLFYKLSLVSGVSVLNYWVISPLLDGVKYWSIEYAGAAVWASVLPRQGRWSQYLDDITPVIISNIMSETDLIVKRYVSRVKSRENGNNVVLRWRLPPVKLDS